MNKKKWIMLALVILVAISLAVAAGVKKSKEGKLAASADKIGIIYIDGVIASGSHSQGGLMGEGGGTDAVIKQIHEARDDQSVKAVVLRINSPGGSASASQEVGEEIQKLRASGKVVVTSMGEVAASGGYWIAAGTDKIYANSATITGSIGVILGYTNMEELMQKVGIRTDKIKSGPHKDIMTPDRPMTAEERAILQGMVNDMYEQFVAVVAEGRKMDPAAVRALADGRIYTGKQAKELGLVDELGNMYDAINGAAALAGVKGKPELKEFGKASPLANLLNLRLSAGVKEMLLQQLLGGTGPGTMPAESVRQW